MSTHGNLLSHFRCSLLHADYISGAATGTGMRKSAVGRCKSENAAWFTNLLESEQRMLV